VRSRHPVEEPTRVQIRYKLDPAVQNVGAPWSLTGSRL